MKKKSCPFQILIIIMNQEKGLEDKIIDILDVYNVDKTIISRANGTAQSSVSDFFGFGITEKNIFTTIIQSEKAEDIVKSISKKMALNKNNKGVVFTLPLTGMDSRVFKNLEVKNEHKN